MKDVSERSLTVSYVAALTIVATLLITCHIILEGELEISKRSGALINTSGRQRMLSQRMAGMAAQYRLGIPGAREELVAATDAFEKNRQELLTEVVENTSRDLDELRLQSLYWDGRKPLAAESKHFIQNARRIAAFPANSPAQKETTDAFLAQAREPLLNELEMAVTLRQRVAEARITDMQRLQSCVLTLVLITLLIEGLAIFRPMVSRIVESHEELIVLATTDQLTGAANRRSFIQSGENEIGRARRYGRPVSFLALDLDHFKSINDRHGHAAGDKALKEVSRSLQQGLRELDVLGRIGGEEFAILLPETSLVQAGNVAERLRCDVAGLQIKHSGKLIAITVSIGVVEVSAAFASLSEVMIAADIALYRAKECGRNCVIFNAA